MPIKQKNEMKQRLIRNEDDYVWEMTRGLFYLNSDKSFVLMVRLPTDAEAEGLVRDCGDLLDLHMVGTTELGRRNARETEEFVVVKSIPAKEFIEDCKKLLLLKTK